MIRLNVTFIISMMNNLAGSNNNSQDVAIIRNQIIIVGAQLSNIISTLKYLLKILIKYNIIF